MRVLHGAGRWMPAFLYGVHLHFFSFFAIELPILNSYLIIGTAMGE